MRIVQKTAVAWSFATCWLLNALPGISAEPSLVMLPAECTLSGANARQGLLVETVQDGQYVGQASGLTIVSSDPKIVKIEDGFAVPVSNGKAVLTAADGPRQASAQVTVEALDRTAAWTFRNHVEPVLAKAGCNSGACHGALAGKRGFRLSLRGFDPVADYFHITRQARARRVVLGDPGRSLLLTKPSGAIPHKGGLRFTTDSPEYRVVAQWIAAGAPAPREDDPRLDKLEILPALAILKPGMKQQLIVRAHFTDGHWEDVTRGAKFTAGNEAVAGVDQAGLVSVAGPGEGTVNAWYLSWNVVATVSVPYEHATPPGVFADSPRRNFIDELVLAKLQNLNLPPSPRATDGELLRRTYLDTIGVLPTAAEAQKYLADASSDKHVKLVEQLLARPEFVDYWSYKWSDLLLVNSEKLKPAAMWSYYQWIRNSVAANQPWDKFARDIVTATGSTLDNGAANFYVLHQDAPDLAETISVAFLGMSINCARCHNHPLEKWSNDQYFAMANLFGRVRTKDAVGEGNRIVFTVDKGDLVQPRSGRPLPPAPLDGAPLPIEAPEDRRVHLANWLTAAENPYFSRAITNRVWANFFGVGLVEGVDDLRLTNPASNERLLAAASGYLSERGYNLKALMRLILLSETYARSSRPLAENMADSRFYSRYYPRRLMAEVLLDSISQVSGASTEFKDYAPGWRSLQLPDSNVTSYFLKTFGRPARIITCECERTAQPSMVQVLHLSNGETINKKLEAKGNRLEKLLAENATGDVILEELYLSALSRYPSESEKAQLNATLAAAPPAERRAALEDLYWSVLSSKEFLFNH